jgi:hypothetical protein
MVIGILGYAAAFGEPNVFGTIKSIDKFLFS